jgi:deazaflavin-dependent oxidoreductase (nitroreductase family)
MNSSLPVFREPSPVEKIFNRVFGFLVGIGIGFSYNYLLQVRGRKSGKLYSTPINLLEWKGKRFLVAPRGRTQWVRNAEAAGEVRLKIGKRAAEIPLATGCRCGEAGDSEGLPRQLQERSAALFPVAAGSPVGAFVELTANYPVFELLAA